MAKMFITGSARSPSNEEFKARIARLAEMPTHHAAPTARRNKSAKPSFPQPTAEAEPDEQASSAEPSLEEPTDETED